MSPEDAHEICIREEPFGEHDAGLGVSLIVGLQPGEHEVEGLASHRRRQRVGKEARIAGPEQRVLHVESAIGTAGQRLTDHLLHTCWTS